jgi:hypothetical protein
MSLDKKSGRQKRPFPTMSDKRKNKFRTLTIFLQKDTNFVLLLFHPGKHGATNIAVRTLMSNLQTLTVYTK